MSAMFLAMVWHARRRRTRSGARAQAASARRCSQRQERFLHDVSHELRTPVRSRAAISRCCGEQRLRRPGGRGRARRARPDRAHPRAAAAARQGGAAGLRRPGEIDVEPFLEDVFMRWSEVAPRAWRLGTLARGTLRADPEALRIALDALLENAVKHTEAADAIELRPRAGERRRDRGRRRGRRRPRDALERIFDRFARADPARRARRAASVSASRSSTRSRRRMAAAAPWRARRTAGPVTCAGFPGFQQASVGELQDRSS